MFLHENEGKIDLISFLNEARTNLNIPKCRVMTNYKAVILSGLVFGAEYIGKKRDNKNHGLGKLIYTNGHVYEGSWQKGKRHGLGKYLWPSGAYYEGAWFEGQKQGLGKYLMSDGRVYEGLWEEG